MTSGEFEQEQRPAGNEIAKKVEAQLRFNPVFLEALTLQTEYANMSITKGEAYDFWRNNTDVARLNEIVRKEKLANQKMTLSGEGVMIPKVLTSILTDSASIQASEEPDEDDVSLESTLTGRVAKGAFREFGLRFKTTYEADVFRPILTYRVAMGRSYTPYATVERFATGDVGISSAVFDNDVFMDELDLLLENLRTLAPGNEEEIESLNSALALEPLKAEYVSFVAWKSKQILEGVADEERQMVEDALSDVVMHYLKRTTSFKMKTPAYLVPTSETDPDSKTYISSRSSPREFEQGVRNVTFMDQYELTEHGPRRIGQRVLYIVIEQDDDTNLAYVPIHELTEFSKA